METKIQFFEYKKKKNHKIRINRPQNCFIRILSLFGFCLFVFSFFFLLNRNNQKNSRQKLFFVRLIWNLRKSLQNHFLLQIHRLFSTINIFSELRTPLRSLNNFSRTHNKMMSTLYHVSRPTVNFRKFLPLMLRMLHNVQWKNDAELSNPSPIFVHSYGWYYIQCRTRTFTSSSAGSWSGEKHPSFGFPMSTKHK